jgi:integrase
MLPADTVEPLRDHLRKVKAVHEQDVADGYGEVHLPYALARKYPNAGKSWGWQYVFPSATLSTDPRTGVIRRHHADEKRLQRAVKSAVERAGIAKPATPHSLRHYLPFLTMSSNVKASAGRIRNYRSHRAEPQSNHPT